MNYRVESTHNVCTVHMNVSAGWEQWFLLRSDAHHDNSHCDHRLERKHLDQAKQRKAGIIEGGDLFCAMQGKWDKRASDSALRKELRGDDYLNRLIDYADDFYHPYAENFLVLAPGNHETSVLKRHGQNLTQSLVDRLKVEHPTTKAPGNKSLSLGSYAGWVRFKFTICKTMRCSLWLYRHHGYGGGGAVTKGVIQTNRMAVYLPDATFVMTGHTHDQWVLPLKRTRINDAGNPFQDTQWHIRCGGYKDEFSPGDGWHIETGKEPKPLGAVWLRFYVEEGDITAKRVSSELIVAT